MKTLTLGHALRAVTCALELAETCYADRPLSVAICDTNGELLSFARMDNAKLLTIELTQRKARTSSRLGCTTQAFLQRLQKEQLDISYFADPRFTALPGGDPDSAPREMPRSRRGRRFIRRKIMMRHCAIAETLLKEIAQ